MGGEEEVMHARRVAITTSCFAACFLLLPRPAGATDFTFVEVLTTFYGGETAHMAVFKAKFFEEYAWMFWLMFTLCFIVPLPFLAIRRLRTLRNLVAVSILINVGMWLERYTIIVPSGARPYLPGGPDTTYRRG